MSRVLLALLAVGRIMRARKPSLAPAVVDARDAGRAVLGASDARGTGFFAAGAEAFGAGLEAVDGLRASFCSAASSPCFAAEDAVGAVRWDGSRTGRVGDRGFGFTNPPVVMVAPGLEAGADEAAFVDGFLTSAAAGLVLAAALAVVPAVAVEGFTGARVVNLGATGFVGSLGAAGLG